MTGITGRERTGDATHSGTARRRTAGGRTTGGVTRSDPARGGSGTVRLVGAGPGDPGLLTVRGREVLRRADAVVYDRLVATALLDACRPDVERFAVGKRPGGPSARQEDINALLIRLARDGKRVVRLKGGDPFVFGRGGEEALALAAAGVRFAVVPGVSAAMAAAAYAGIPVTQRGLASSFAVLTGHDGLRRARLADADTLVVLMAVAPLPEIAARLIELGRRPDEPAALIHAASTRQQRIVLGTLATLPHAVRREEVASPATLVVGPTVPLSERLAWFKPDAPGAPASGSDATALGASEAREARCANQPADPTERVE